MPVFTAAALNSDPDGLALLCAVLNGPEQAGSAQARPFPIRGCTKDVTVGRTAGHRGMANGGRVHVAAHSARLA